MRLHKSAFYLFYTYQIPRKLTNNKKYSFEIGPFNLMFFCFVFFFFLVMNDDEFGIVLNFEKKSRSLKYDHVNKIRLRINLRKYPTTTKIRSCFLHFNCKSVKCSFSEFWFFVWLIFLKWQELRQREKKREMNNNINQ